MADKIDSPMQNKCTIMSFISVVCAILGFMTFYLLEILEGSLLMLIISTEMYIFNVLLAIVIEIIAIVLGVTVKKRGDKYGKYGMILGVLAIVFTILTSVTIYIYIPSI